MRPSSTNQKPVLSCATRGNDLRGSKGKGIWKERPSTAEMRTGSSGRSRRSKGSSVGLSQELQQGMSERFTFHLAMTMMDSFIFLFIFYKYTHTYKIYSLFFKSGSEDAPSTVLEYTNSIKPCMESIDVAFGWKLISLTLRLALGHLFVILSKWSENGSCRIDWA